MCLYFLSITQNIASASPKGAGLNQPRVEWREHGERHVTLGFDTRWTRQPQRGGPNRLDSS